MTNKITTFIAVQWAHVVHLFQAEVPKIEALLQPEIDLAEAAIKKYGAVDLTSLVGTVAAGIAGGNPAGAVIAAGAAALKAEAVAQGIEVVDEEATFIATAAHNQATASVASVAAGNGPTLSPSGS